MKDWLIAATVTVAYSLALVSCGSLAQTPAEMPPAVSPQTLPADAETHAFLLSTRVDGDLWTGVYMVKITGGPTTCYVVTMRMSMTGSPTSLVVPCQ